MLNLELNQLGDEGAIAIARVLADQHHSYDGLHALNLGSNEITCDGTMHLSKALEDNMSLHVLNLSSNLVRTYLVAPAVRVCDCATVRLCDCTTRHDCTCTTV